MAEPFPQDGDPSHGRKTRNPSVDEEEVGSQVNMILCLRHDYSTSPPSLSHTDATLSPLVAAALQRRPGVESIVSCATTPSTSTSENAAMVLSFILIQNRQ